MWGRDVLTEYDFLIEQTMLFAIGQSRETREWMYTCVFDEIE